MSILRVVHAVLRKVTGSGRLLVVCAVLVAVPSVPLQAQLIFNDLHDFNCNVEGCNPFDLGYLTQGVDGNLYGTGYAGYGGIIMLTPSGANTDLWTFNGATGRHPYGGLTLASDGNFYGTTFNGGTSDLGVVFRFTPPGTLTVLHSFDGTDGENPEVAPTQGKDGNLYGVTGSGTTYRVTLPSGTFQQLPNSVPPGTGGWCGQCTQLYLASDGNLYGATETGGQFNAGTIYSMDTSGAITIVHSFQASGSDGADPVGPLTQASDGYLYGTTSFGGANGSGEVFKMTLGGSLTLLHSFDALDCCGYNSDGAWPDAGVVAAPDGYFYGVSLVAGLNGYGTIYRITSGGAFEKLFDFSGDAGAFPGSVSSTTLVEHTNGSMYGLTEIGGPFENGNYFSLTPQNNRVQIVRIAGPIFVHPGIPVQILGNSLTQAYSVAFAGEPTSFRVGSDTVLTAQVPQDAVDGLITLTYVTGLQAQTQLPIHIMPAINSFDPPSGPPGTRVTIAGGGFTGATQVSFGSANASFTFVSPTQIVATVPVPAKNGGSWVPATRIQVTTPNGTAKSKKVFRIR